MCHMIIFLFFISNVNIIIFLNTLISIGTRIR